MEENKKTFNWVTVGGMVGLVFGILAVVFAFINGGSGYKDFTDTKTGAEYRVHYDFGDGVMEAVKTCKDLTEPGKKCKALVALEIEILKTSEVDKNTAADKIEKSEPEKPGNVDKGEAEVKDESAAEPKEEVKQSENKFEPEKVEMSKTEVEEPKEEKKE